MKFSFAASPNHLLRLCYSYFLRNYKINYYQALIILYMGGSVSNGRKEN